MSLFQKNPSTPDRNALYTLGLNKSILVVGLGNPGPNYDGTRHNIGFYCLDSFVDDSGFTPWVNKKDMKSSVATSTMGDTRVVALKPTTYMNLSGEAVQAIAQFYKIPAEQILVIHDELDINFGQIRLRPGGGSGGHNGIKSLIEHIGDNFGRIRIGIGPKSPEQIDNADFVLQKFNAEQRPHLPMLAREVNAIINEFVFGDGALPTETRSFIA